MVPGVDFTMFKVIVTRQKWKKKLNAADLIAAEQFSSPFDRNKGERRDAVAGCA